MAWSGFDSTYQSFQHTAAAARVAGVPELREDMIAVPLADAAADAQATMIYKAEEVEADKLGAAGAIAVGELVRMSTAAATIGEVNTNAASATNVACGFCSKAATSSATKIVIRFDGTPRGE